MATPSGEIVETPTAELPYKVVISHEGEIVREQYFEFSHRGGSLHHRCVARPSGGFPRREACALTRPQQAAAY